MAYKLDGIVIKSPTSFATELYKLTKAGRLASGKMVMDVIAKKRKFQLEYTVLSGTDLTTITDILFNDSAFYTFEYVENNTTKTATVYVGAITYDRFRSDGRWYWTNVEFDLIEQ